MIRFEHAGRTPPSLTTAAALALALSLGPGAAPAAVLMHEGFHYSNGPLVPNGGWSAISSAGSKTVQVAAGKVVLQQSAGVGEDVSRAFPSQSAGASVFAAFFLTVPPGAIGTGTEYFAHFRQAVANNFRTRVAVGPGPASPGDYGLYLQHGGTSPSFSWPVRLRFNVTYLIVTQYDGAANLSRLWVNPVSSASPSISVSDVTPPVPLDSYGFRQASPVGATFVEWIDELRVATTFADVYPVLDVVDLSGDASDAAHPKLTRMEDGGLFAVWGRAGYRVAYSHSPGKGVNFSEPRLLDVPSRHPATIQTNNEVLLVAAVTHDLSSLRTGPGEITVGPVIASVDPTDNAARPEFAKDAAAETTHVVAIVWDADSSVILYSQTSDDGATFKSAEAIGPSDGHVQWRPDIARYSYRVEAMWNCSASPSEEWIMHTRTSVPNLFQVPDRISAMGRRARDPQVSYAGPSTWDAVWIELGVGGGPDSLVLATSSSDGVVYTKQFTVAIPALPGTARHTSMIRSADGALHIAFDATVNGSIEVLYASIPSTRNAFSGPFILSGSPGASTDPCVAIDVNGRPVFVWSELIGGVRDIAFTRWLLP